MNLMISITNNSKFILLFLLIFIILFFPSCKQSTEPKLEVEMILELEDVSCTEAWIKLTTNNLQLPATINLIKNNTVAQSFSLSSKDSLLYIDSLLPNQNYKFLVTMQQLNNRSNELSVTTMDTTSHEFSWQSWEFGECSSSSLYDVAIIDENNIWAVGEIYMRDSLGNCDPNAYNAVHWDGTKWELKRITVNFRGSFITPPLEGLFAFSSTDIWFVGSLPIHGDGSNWQIYDLRTLVNPNLTVSKAWGTDSNNMYFVGRNGNIAHWDGVRWRKIESGTDVNLRDVWGTTGSNEIFISGYSTDLSKSILLKLKNNTAETIWENNTISGTPPYGNLIYSITGFTNNLFVSSNLGIYKHKFMINFPSQKLFTVPRRVYKVAATNVNDIYTAGDRSNVWHYNGLTRKELYVNLSVPSPYYSAAVSTNIFVSVGTIVENAIYHKAMIIILRRL